MQYRGNYWQVHNNDALTALREVPAGTAACCVTSPPYWALRKYHVSPLVWGGDMACQHEWGDEQVLVNGSGPQGKTGQRGGGGDDPREAYVRSSTIVQSTRGLSQGRWCQKCGAWLGDLGLEPTPELYIRHLVDIFEEVRRVMHDDGVLWVNIGDSYAANRSYQVDGTKQCSGSQPDIAMRVPEGLKPKDLIGIPWMLAFALREAGWWLRQDVVWHKPNAMPSSVTDRPVTDYEHVFMLTKSQRYYFDFKAVQEPFSDSRNGCDGGKQPRQRNRGGRTDGFTTPSGVDPSKNGGRRRRAVWSIPTSASGVPHYATYPPALVEPCILSSSRPMDVVLDPFAGVGTTAVVALRHCRRFVGVELSEEYTTKWLVPRLQEFDEQDVEDF